MSPFVIRRADVILWAALAAACSTTYKNVSKLETNWLGQVSEVEGGTSTSHTPGWLSGLSDLTGNLTWFMVAGVVVFAILLWKAPWLFRKIKENRAARAAQSRRSD